MGATLQEILAELDTTPDEIAVLLKVRSIRGVRNTVRFLNPIVRYIESRLRVDALGLDVIKGNVLRLHHADGRSEEWPLPPGVLSFLAAFNSGQYPHLEMTQEVQSGGAS